MANLTDLDKWVAHIKEDLGLWLVEQVNKRLKHSGLICANEQRLENGSIKRYDLGSPDFPKSMLAELLKAPLCTPFVGYSILVLYLRQSGHRLRKRSAPVKRAERNLLEEAWEFMEENGKTTVEENNKCLGLLEKLSREWEQYDKTLLTRLSFVPEPAIAWGLTIRQVLREERPKRASFIRRYSNPRTDLKNDAMVADELRDLPPETQRRIIAQSFRVIDKKAEKQILQTMGIDKNSDSLRQGIWHLILPPLFDYLVLLQGDRPRKQNYDRAYREASLILNARYPLLWPHSPRRIRHYTE